MSHEKSSSGERKTLLSLGFLLTDCETSGRYNSARAHFYETCHDVILFLIILSGSAALANILSETSMPWVYLMPAILASLDLVFRFHQKANRHAIIAMKFWQLHGEVAADMRADSKVKSEWNQRIHNLYGEEVAAYRILQAVCHNATAIAMDRPGKMIKVSFWQNAFKQLWRFPSFKAELVQAESVQTDKTELVQKDKTESVQKG